MRRHATLSASAFGLAMLCASMWWGAFTSMVLLHDDAKFARALTATLDEPDVRTELARWLTAAIENGAERAGRDLTGNATLLQLQKAVNSRQRIAPMSDAITTVAVRARDAAVDQLDRDLDPKRAVRLELTPVFQAAGIPVDRSAARAMGLTLDQDVLSTPLLTPAQLDAMQFRYTVTRWINTWGGWMALALLAVSVATSARPLRTLAVACGVLTVLAIIAPAALTYLATWLGSRDLGLLAQPVVTATSQAIGPYTLPVATAGLLLALGFAAAQMALTRRRRSE